MCTTNGFLVDIAGLFTGNKNDAEKLLQIMKSSEGISKIVKSGDIFILDRGFWDEKIFLEEQGYRVLMPALKGKWKQLTTEESNDWRFVTKVSDRDDAWDSVDEGDEASDEDVDMGEDEDIDEDEEMRNLMKKDSDDDYI
ncbi:hypothetical protein CBL_20452 [Carabus blaptoides fortunei]